MTLQLLVAAVDQSPVTLADMMQIDSDAIIVSQGRAAEYQKIEYKGHSLEYYAMEEKGVGLNRNTALMHATAEYILFADEDIVYHQDYAKTVLECFQKHPEADMLLFNVKAMAGRETYHNEDYGKVSRMNYGRYPTYSFAVKRELVINHNITFSLLFGGGAKYSNGEDSLFLRDCLKAGLSVYRVPEEIGFERERESTWFKGYNEKFFFDRGVLYRHLYGNLAKPLAMRFLLAHGKEMCVDIPRKKAYEIMKKGIREAGV